MKIYLIYPNSVTKYVAKFDISLLISLIQKITNNNDV